MMPHKTLKVVGKQKRSELIQQLRDENERLRELLREQQRKIEDLVREVAKLKGINASLRSKTQSARGQLTLL